MAGETNHDDYTSLQNWLGDDKPIKYVLDSRPNLKTNESYRVLNCSIVTIHLLDI